VRMRCYFSEKGAAWNNHNHVNDTPTATMPTADSQQPAAQYRTIANKMDIAVYNTIKIRISYLELSRDESAWGWGVKPPPW